MSIAVWSRKDVAEVSLSKLICLELRENLLDAINLITEIETVQKSKDATPLRRGVSRSQLPET
jgi:hypothetical protein